MPEIGTLREKSLHAALKEWYAQPSDRLEVKVDGFVIDIVRDELLIEIQTRNFAAMKRKLPRLLEHHPLRLVYPIAQEKWIRRVAADGRTLGRRKSSKQGRVEDLFHELVSFPQLIEHPNFSLEVILIQEEEVRTAEAERSRAGWRRHGWAIHDHKLLGVVAQRVFASPEDFCEFLPPTLATQFTNQDLAEALGEPNYLAQQMTYCLRRMGVVELAGKRGRALLYQSSK